MSFFGVFGEGRARALAQSRASYLCAPVLHFSMDGRILLAVGTADETVSAVPYPHLFAATASKKRTVSVSTVTLLRLYQRRGKHFSPHLSHPTAFALYDSRRATLYLGGTGGEVCYIEEAGDTLLFSSDPDLLRAPRAVSHAVFKE